MKIPFRFRSRAFSVALTVIVLCALILTAFIADNLEARNALQKDYSFNGATTQSQVTSNILKRLTRDVHFYVIHSEGNTNTTLLSLLARYASLSEHFTYSEENIAENPVLLTMFNTMLGEGQVTSDCIVIYCRETERAKVITEQDFPVFEYSTETGYYIQTGVNYEKPFTEGIVYVTQNEPLTIQTLSGHHELNGENLENFETLLTSRHYFLQPVNLLNGDTLDPAKPLVIISPQFDISEKELELLMAFSEQGGDLLVLSNYSDPLDLTNYNTFLLEYGVGFFPGLVMAKTEDRQSYYDERQAFLLPMMLDTDLTHPLITANTSVLMMPGSRALRLPTIANRKVTIENQIITGKSYIRNYVETEPDSIEQQPTDEEGYFSLAVLSTRITDSGKVSNALIIGNTLMFTDYWVESNTYSSNFLLRSIEYLQGSSPIDLAIPAKQAVRAPLSFGSMVPYAMAAFVMPLLVLAFALWLLLRRKHS